MEIKKYLENPQEFKKIAKMTFDSFDTNHSGTIDITKLSLKMNDIAKHSGRPAPDMGAVEKWVKALGSEEKDEINFEEFSVIVKRILVELYNNKK